MIDQDRPAPPPWWPLKNGQPTLEPDDGDPRASLKTALGFTVLFFTFLLSFVFIWAYAFAFVAVEFTIGALVGGAVKALLGLVISSASLSDTLATVSLALAAGIVILLFWKRPSIKVWLEATTGREGNRTFTWAAVAAGSLIGALVGRQWWISSEGSLLLYRIISFCSPTALIGYFAYLAHTIPAERYRIIPKPIRQSSWFIKLIDQAVSMPAGPPDTFRFICPICQEALNASLESRGKRTRCPSCEEIVVIEPT